MNVLVGLFWQYGRTENVAKSRTIMCQPGAIRLGISEEAKALKCMGWETRTRWDSEEGYHAKILELYSLWGQWRHIFNACTGRNPQLTEDSWWSFRRITNIRFTMWDFRSSFSNAPASSLDALGLPTHGMDYAHTLTASTGAIASVSERNTPTPTPSARDAGSKYQRGD